MVVFPMGQEFFLFNQVIQIIDVVANLAIVGSLIFAGYQTMLSKKSYEVSNERHEKEKAIELAEVYAKEVIPRLSYICAIYERIGINEIFSKLKNEKLKKFDKSELSDLIDNNDLSKIKNSLKTIDYFILLTNKAKLSREEHTSLQMYLKMTSILKLKNGTELFSMDLQDIHELLKSKMTDKDKIGEFFGIIEKLRLDYINVKQEFENQKNDLLNILEYFCMYLNTGVADEKVIYQSLHQSFLAVVKVCYYDIAVLNETGKDKYYTNIIELYSHWNNRYSLECSREENLLAIAEKVKEEVRNTTTKSKKLSK